MRILHVINIGYKAGGAEASVIMLRDQLRKDGHEVRVLSTDIPGGEFFSDYQIPQIQTTGLLRVFYFMFYPRAYYIMKKIISEFNPDIIHFHTTALFSPSIFIASRRIPSILTVHGPEPFTLDLLPWALSIKDYSNGSYDLHDLTFVGKLHYLYFRFIIRSLYLLCLHRVQYFVAPSKYMADVIKRDFPIEKIIQIYNGIDLPDFSSIKNYNQVLFVGRLERVKGVSYLIDSLTNVLSVLQDTELHIVGDGPDREELEHQVKKLNLAKNVTFHGWIKNKDEVISQYENATILVVPSTWPENLGSVCIEAMAVGRPIIGTNTGGIPELIKDSITGYLVPIKDSREISKKIINLLTNKDILDTMSLESSKHAVKFNIGTFTENILDLYERAIKNKK